MVKTLAKIDLDEVRPKGFDARLGPRSVSWRPDQPSTLYWAEALDSGDPKADTKKGNEIKMLSAPFENNAVTLFYHEPKIVSYINWGDKRAIVNERWWAKDLIKEHSLIHQSLKTLAVSSLIEPQPIGIMILVCL